MNGTTPSSPPSLLPGASERDWVDGELLARLAGLVSGLGFLGALASSDTARDSHLAPAYFAFIFGCLAVIVTFGSRASSRRSREHAAGYTTFGPLQPGLWYLSPKDGSVIYDPDGNRVPAAGAGAGGRQARTRSFRMIAGGLTCFWAVAVAVYLNVVPGAALLLVVLSIPTYLIALAILILALRSERRQG